MKNNNLKDNYENLMNYALKLYCRDTEEDNNGLIAVYEEYFKDYLKNVDCISFKGQYEKIFEPFIQRAVNSSSRLLKIYAYANKGYYLNCIGDYPKAYECNEEAFKLCKEEFKEDNQVTINVMSNLVEAMVILAESYESAGPDDDDYSNYSIQKERALELRLKVLEYRTNHFGEKDQETIHALADVADAYRWVCEYEKAVKTGSEALELYKTEFGEKNPYTIYARINLSTYLHCLKNDSNREEINEKLLKFDEETLELCKEVFGEDDEDTIGVMINVRDDLRNLERDEERADELNEKVNEYYLKLEE